MKMKIKRKKAQATNRMQTDLAIFAIPQHVKTRNLRLLTLWVNFK